MKLALLLIIAISISSCEKTMGPILYKEDQKWALANKIYDNEIGEKVFLQLKKERNLNVCESGWGLRGRQYIRCMHCGFDYFTAVTLEEARQLLFDATNLYLKTINENEGIRPFLDNYPFGLDNIEITIFLYNSDGSLPSPDRLQTISIQEGTLRYKIGEENPNGMRKIICQETYQEALAKLKQEESMKTTLKDPPSFKRQLPKKS